MQPGYVGDLAALAVEAAAMKDNVVLDAVGPEIYAFNGLLLLICERIGSRSRIAHIPSAAAFAAGRALGWLLRDVIINRDEIGGLMAGLLASDRPPTCPTRFSEWVREHTAELGREYASESERHYR